jgi:hypothetical protein
LVMENQVLKCKSEHFKEKFTLVDVASGTKAIIVKLVKQASFDAYLNITFLISNLLQKLMPSIGEKYWGLWTNQRKYYF